MVIVESLARSSRDFLFSPGREPAWKRAVRSAVPAVVGYLVVRFIGLGFLWLWARAEHESLLGLLGTMHDSAWYLEIIDHGYDHGASAGNRGESAQSNMAFFPLYPMLARVLSTMTPLGSVGAALVLAWSAGIAAAWGVFVLGTHLHGRRTGTILAVLWGVLPHAIVESMAYTESLFTALAVWSLYALLTKRWLTAGALCLLTGLTRPTAVALIAVVCLVALVAAARCPSDWRAWVALVIAPIGWVGYLVWVGLRVGHLDGWFSIQNDWGSSFDGGRYTFSFALDILTKESHLDYYVVTLVLVLAVVLLVHGVLQQQPWPLLLYSGVLLVLTIGGSGYYNSKARFLLVAVPLLLPVATALATTRSARTAVTLGTLTLISAYCGGYLLLVWPSSP